MGGRAGAAYVGVVEQMRQRGRERAAVPRPARSGGGTARSAPRRAAAGAPGAPARPGAPRLTGLGGGLLAIAAMVLLGGVVRLLLGASPGVYGVGFVLVGLASALWVRPGDQFTAPVVAPIAYAAGLVVLTGGSGGGGGWGERVMTVVTALAVEAPWVYGGTAATALAAVVRRAVRAARRRGELRRRRERGGHPAGDGRHARLARPRAPGVREQAGTLRPTGAREYTGTSQQVPPPQQARGGRTAPGPRGPSRSRRPAGPV